jgi:hypothetical protein
MALKCSDELFTAIRDRQVKGDKQTINSRLTIWMFFEEEKNLNGLHFHCFPKRICRISKLQFCLDSRQKVYQIFQLPSKQKVVKIATITTQE